MSERERRPLAIVAAVGRNGAIGQGGALPWHLPGDLARFKALPGRESIVVSRDAGLGLPAGVHRAVTPDAGRALAEDRAAAMGANEISLIGGATLFDAMIDEADRLYMTFVDLAPAADTFFPPIDAAIWREAARLVPERHPGDEAACVFVDYVRR